LEDFSNNENNKWLVSNYPITICHSKNGSESANAPLFGIHVICLEFEISKVLKQVTWIPDVEVPYKDFRFEDDKSAHDYILIKIL
jgi:hypothetical protein